MVIESRKGELHGVHIGALKPPQLDQKIEELLAESFPDNFLPSCKWVKLCSLNKQNKNLTYNGKGQYEVLGFGQDITVWFISAVAWWKLRHLWFAQNDTLPSFKNGNWIGIFFIKNGESHESETWIFLLT